MATRSISQLKAWFRRGKYPTEEQFADLIDSYVHKEESKIPIANVENLPEQLNGKYAADYGKELERQQKKLRVDFDEHKSHSEKLINDITDDIDELEAELIKRIQGKSNKSSPYDDPFKLVRFTSWTEFTAWLDELHTTDGTPDNQKAGFFRVNINGIQREVHNFVLSWSENRFIQVLIGLFGLNADGTLAATGTYSIVQRKYDNGAWTNWTIDTVDGKKSTVGTISFNNLDTMFSLTTGTAGLQNLFKVFTGELPSRWTVVDNSFSPEQPIIVGTMDIFSDNMRHQVTQVLTSHYLLNDNGTGFNGHSDTEIFTYFRSFGFSSSMLERGAWSAWKKVFDGEAFRQAFFPSRHDTTDIDKALESGVYPWCRQGSRPNGSIYAFTCFVKKSTTVDNNGFYIVEQTAYGREQQELGKVWKRLIFYKESEQQYGNWIEISEDISKSQIIIL